MSVLVRGMEMPTSCGDCRFCGGIADTDCGPCAWCDVDGKARVADTRQNCPIVPVPQHGRLIDADALLEWARERDDGGPVNWVDSLDLTIWAGHHTIIEAEEGIK